MQGKESTAITAKFRQIVEAKTFNKLLASSLLLHVNVELHILEKDYSSAAGSLLLLSCKSIDKNKPIFGCEVDIISIGKIDMGCLSVVLL